MRSISDIRYQFVLFMILVLLDCVCVCVCVYQSSEGHDECDCGCIFVKPRTGFSGLIFIHTINAIA